MQLATWTTTPRTPPVTAGTAPARGRTGTAPASRRPFGTAAVVIALCLWSSASPSVLYPVYAADWGLSSTVTTSVFAAYPAALVLMLLLAGGISDRIGRRAAMLAGTVAMALAAAVFLVAGGVAMLVAGRVLQGVGTGLALGAAGAALVENDVSGRPSRVSSTTTCASAGGLALSTVVGGALVQYAPMPRHLLFVVLLVLAAGVAVLVAQLPRPVRDPAARTGSLVSAVRVPAGLRTGYVVAAVPVATAFAVGALFLALGAQMARELVGTSNVLVTGAALAVLPVSLAATALTLRGLTPHRSIVAGGVLSAVGLAALELTDARGSLALFFGTGVVAGAGYALGFGGGLRLVNGLAPAHHRGQLLSAMYLAAYLLQGVVAVGAGLTATSHGLDAALHLAVPVLAALALAGSVLAVADAHRRRRPAEA